MKKLTILVACGSGVATSTVAQEAAKKICADAGIQAKFIKSTMTEIPSKEDVVDLILVTTNFRKPCSKPIIKAFGLISGINLDAVQAEIVETCKKIQNEQ